MNKKTISLSPDARVIIKDAQWLVRKIDKTSTGRHAISVVGISELVKDKEAIFMVLDGQAKPMMNAL